MKSVWHEGRVGAAIGWTIVHSVMFLICFGGGIALGAFFFAVFFPEVFVQVFGKR